MASLVSSPFARLPKWMFVPLFTHLTVLLCCCGRLLSHYYKSDRWVRRFQYVLWTSSSFGHVVLVIIILLKLNGFKNIYIVFSTPLTFYRTWKKNVSKIGGVVSILLFLAILFVGYSCFYRFLVLHELVGFSRSQQLLLVIASGAYFAFVATEGLYLIILLVNDRTLEAYKGNREKTATLRNGLQCLSLVNGLLLGYDITWIIYVVELYGVRHVWIFEVGFHITHVSTLLYDIIALMALFDIYTYVKFDIEEPQVTKKEHEASDEAKAYLGGVERWKGYLNLSSWAFFIIAIMRTIANLKDFSAYVFEGSDAILSVALWIVGIMSISVKIFVLYRLLFKPFFISLRQRTTSDIPSVLFFLFSITMSVLVVFEQIFEAYDMWLKDMTVPLLGVVPLGLYGICYAALLVAEGLVMIWLSNTSGQEDLHREDVILILQTAQTSSKLYFGHSVLYLTTVPQGKIITAIGRLCGPPLFHFAVTLYYASHISRWKELRPKIGVDLLSSLIELLNVEHTRYIVALCLVPEVLRLRLPSQRGLISLGVRFFYIFACIFWIKWMVKLQGLTIIWLCLKKIFKTLRNLECHKFLKEVILGMFIFSLTLATILASCNRAYFTFNKWTGSKEISYLLLIVLLPLQCISVTFQSLLLGGMAIVSGTIKEVVKEGSLPNLVENISKLSTLNVVLYLDNLTFTITTAEVESRSLLLFQCTLLVYHLVSCALVYYVSNILASIQINYQCVPSGDIKEDNKTDSEVKEGRHLLSSYVTGLPHLGTFMIWKNMALIANEWEREIFTLTMLLGIAQKFLEEAVAVKLAFRTCAVLALLLVNTLMSFYITRNIVTKDHMKKIIKDPFSLLIVISGLLGMLEVWTSFLNQQASHPLENALLILLVLSNFTFIAHEAVVILFLVKANKQCLSRTEYSNVVGVLLRANGGYAIYGILSVFASLTKHHNGELSLEILLGQLTCSVLVPMMMIPILMMKWNDYEESMVIANDHYSKDMNTLTENWALSKSVPCSLPHTPPEKRKYVMSHVSSCPNMPSEGHEYVVPHVLPVTPSEGQEYVVPHVLPVTPSEGHEYV